MSMEAVEHKADAARSELVELFEYPATPHAPYPPDWTSWLDAPDASTPEEPSREPAHAPSLAAMQVEFEQKLAEQTRRSFEAGRERGHQEGCQSERESHAAADKSAADLHMRQRAALLESFSQERDRFLHTIEQEVVRLALAVAARILRREAQMDPLLLTGAVRVALGQLSGSTEVRLRVPLAELDLWRDAIALLPNLAVKPTVSAGEGMRLGECVVETALGSVDLGIRSQLAEIERGFFDRTGITKSASDFRNASMPAAPTGTDSAEVRP